MIIWPLVAKPFYQWWYGIEMICQETYRDHSCSIRLQEKQPNGLRYLRCGGDGEAVQPEKSYGVGNCLKTAQNPQRQVHALLGALTERQTRLLVQATTAKLTKLFHEL